MDSYYIFPISIKPRINAANFVHINNNTKYLSQNCGTKVSGGGMWSGNGNRITVVTLFFSFFK